MTPSEAIQHIKRHIEVHRIKEPQAIYITEALKMACDALEKQIPQKVNTTPYFYGVEIHCPFCNYLLGREYEGDEGYCKKCGSAFRLE